MRTDFAAWRALSADHAKAYDDIDALWASPEMATALGDLASREHPSQPATHRRPASRWGMTIAASVAVLGLAFWQGPELLLRSKADLLTERGEVQTHALPDGSTITLNTGSAVTLDFADGRRHVELLRGEAYFDVLPDRSHPFTVAGGASEVLVTGTAFSLASFPDEDRLTVAEGHVRFWASGTTHSAEIVAGQSAAAGETTEPVPVNIDVPSDLAWREGRIVITALPLWQAIDELQRYRSMPIILANIDRKDLRVTGDFRIDDIDSAVTTLAAAAGLTSTQLPGSVLLVH